MKTTINNLMAVSIVLAVITFVTLAAIYVVRMTEAGLINWNN